MASKSDFMGFPEDCDNGFRSAAIVVPKPELFHTFGAAAHRVAEPRKAGSRRESLKARSAPRRGQLLWLTVALGAAWARTCVAAGFGRGLAAAKCAFFDDCGITSRTTEAGAA